MIRKHFSKKLYVYLALVTMAAVSLFAHPIKRWRAKNKPKKHKPSLRVLLGLDPQQSDFNPPKKKKHPA